jgi:CheY-like chemotaxis protein
MMHRNIELESQLIDDLLDLTRTTKDKMQLDFEPVDVHQAVRGVVEMCASEANGKKLQVRFDLQATDFRVMADPAKFQQIVWNLFKNAIKFTGESGTITIASANHLPHILNLSVSDTGIGIEPEVMERIFNPFEQGERSFQRRFGGLGLGCAALQRLLTLRGHEVMSAPGMRAALELAGASGDRFELLISDVGLPDGNGMDLLRYLRIKQPIRGIAISGFGMDSDIGKSLEAGFSEHLVKPVRLEKLEAAIARVMANATSPRQT